MAPWTIDHIRARLERAAADAAPHDPPERRAAVAIALELGESPRVLLMRRTAHPQDPWSGQVSLPGGRREPEDGDLVETAVRETREELSVDLLAHASLLGPMAPVQARARGRVVPMDVSPFVFALEREVAPAPSEEAEEAFWLPLDRALRGDLDHQYRYEGTDGLVRKLPSWRFEERVVWGLTYGILSRLLTTLGGG
ncbi:MAG: CoA pyrophosphatase [Planctomycetota bacterium]